MPRDVRNTSRKSMSKLLINNNNRMAEISESIFISFLTQPGTGISLKQANDLVACLKTFGIVFIS
jgi:hypothetical protein